jgi:hypothetical protein
MNATTTQPTTIFTLASGTEFIDFEPLPNGKILITWREVAEAKYVTRPDGTFRTARLDMTRAKARQLYADKVASGFRRIA